MKINILSLSLETELFIQKHSNKQRQKETLMQ